jgi:hypothetical protein
MPSEDKQWEINLVKDRYYWLKLSQAQAELVYKFEQEERALLSAYTQMHNETRLAKPKREQLYPVCCQCHQTNHNTTATTV